MAFDIQGGYPAPVAVRASRSLEQGASVNITARHKAQTEELRRGAFNTSMSGRFRSRCLMVSSVPAFVCHHLSPCISRGSAIIAVYPRETVPGFREEMVLAKQREWPNHASAQSGYSTV